MAKWGFIIALAVASQWLVGQTDSTSVFDLIETSSSETDAFKALNMAQRADTLSAQFGLVTQLAARENLLEIGLKFDRSYLALRTFLQLNKLLVDARQYARVVENYQRLGDYYAGKNMLSSAVEKHAEAAAIAQNNRVAFDFWQNNMRIGELRYQLAEYDKALGLFKEALTLSATNQRKIKAHRKLAQTHNALRDFEGAIQNNEAVLGLIDQQADPDAYVAQLNNLGYAYHKLGDQEKALDYFQRTLRSREKQGLKDIDNLAVLINIGIAYQNLNDIPNSLRYLNRALAASSTYREKSRINDLIALAYLANDDALKAQQYNRSGRKQAQQAGDRYLEAEALYTSSLINEKLLAFDKALDNFRAYLEITDSLRTAEQSRQQGLLQAEYAIERTQGEIQQLIASNEIKDYQIEQLRLEGENKEKALELQEAQARAKLQALQLERTQFEAAANEKEVEALKAREENQRLQLQQQKLEEERAKQELKIAEEQNRIQELELEKNKAANRNLYIILSLGLLLLILIVYALWRTNKSRKQLAESRDIIRQERDRSDNLLLNILPETTANELKREGRAAPRNIEAATVFFSDFKSFSSLSKEYSPNELIEELELFFGGFDRINAKYGIEKIKTIGDAYMCASGLPQPQEDHALRMVRAAMEMLAFAREINEEQIARNREPWQLRIGINSGPVVAGVIGSKKFIYDVWGDTVNLASRLETTGEPGKINISQNTLDLIRAEIRCEYRGEIEVKNMGSVKMFFVVGERLVADQTLS
jgi:adenylate cyclase